LRAVLAGLNGSVEASHLRRREEISPAQSNGWKKRLLDPTTPHEQRRCEMAEARRRRREKDLQLRQPTLPLEFQKGVAEGPKEKSYCRCNTSITGPAAHLPEPP
jgi:hypothetical protein